jgi:hypothetical protein
MKHPRAIKPAFRNPPKPAARIMVLPRDDEVRRKIKHSPTRAGAMPIPFREEGPTSWPFDSETRRLLASGHITRADAEQDTTRGDDDAD